MQGTPARLTAAAHSRARASSRSTGFSQKIALPDAAARWIRSACVSVDDAIATARIEGSANTPSTLPTLASCCEASAAAACASGSTTYFSRTPGCLTMLPAWILPIRPAPKIATSIIDCSVVERRWTPACAGT